MEHLYLIKELKEKQLRQAYSLVQVACPSAKMENWFFYASQLTNVTDKDAPSCGAKGLFGPHEYLYGLYTYRTGERPGIGSVLDVQDYCVMTPFEEDGAAELLLASMKRLAWDLDCNILRLSCLDDSQWGDAAALADRPCVVALLSD